ncbi:MAG: ABC transporter ATP-binding protein [Candidatus Acidiferrales bacterium]
MNYHPIFVEDLEKYFPPALSGWRALVYPFAKPTERALAGLSFRLEPGEVMALIGANGAGKSTLLRILATLIIPTRGRAAVAGFDVERQEARAREQIGYYAGGDQGFYARLTARENLQFFAAMNNLDRGKSTRQIARLTELMRVESILDRQVRTLSTGTVHRLGLSRALLHEPAVLLLDEPTRSLDPMAAGDFRRFLRSDLVEKGSKTLLFASHSLEEVQQLADRVAIIDQGKLIACDTPSRLCAAAGVSTLEQVCERMSRPAVTEPSL